MSDQEYFASETSFARASDQIISAIEQQPWLDSIGRGLEKSLEEVLRISGAAGRQVRDFLSGTWFGHPLHPSITDVPVGAWTASLVLDFLDAFSEKEANAYGKAADVTIEVGIVGALGAALSGLVDWRYLHSPSKRLGTTHGLMNAAALAAYLASLQLRKHGSRGAGRLLSTLGYALVFGSSYLGGHLVFREGAGTIHSDHPTAHHRGDEGTWHQADERFPEHEKTLAR